MEMWEDWVNPGCRQCMRTGPSFLIGHCPSDAKLMWCFFWVSQPIIGWPKCSCGWKICSPAELWWCTPHTFVHVSLQALRHGVVSSLASANAVCCHIDSVERLSTRHSRPDTLSFAWGRSSGLSSAVAAMRLFIKLSADIRDGIQYPRWLCLNLGGGYLYHVWYIDIDFVSFSQYQCSIHGLDNMNTKTRLTISRFLSRLCQYQDILPKSAFIRIGFFLGIFSRLGSCKEVFRILISSRDRLGCIWFIGIESKSLITLKILWYDIFHQIVFFKLNMKLCFGHIV